MYLFSRSARPSVNYGTSARRAVVSCTVRKAGQLGGKKIDSEEDDESDPLLEEP